MSTFREVGAVTLAGVGEALRSEELRRNVSKTFAMGCSDNDVGDRCSFGPQSNDSTFQYREPFQFRVESIATIKQGDACGGSREDQVP